MVELKDVKIKMLVGKAVKAANANADELESLGASPEVVRLVRPRAYSEPEYNQAPVQAYMIHLGDKIEIGGHLTEVVGIGDEGTQSIIIHALDLVGRVYELKLPASQALVIHRKK